MMVDERWKFQGKFYFILEFYDIHELESLCTHLEYHYRSYPSVGCGEGIVSAITNIEYENKQELDSLWTHLEINIGDIPMLGVR
jgi:hypothetical protein